jgi:transposase-like protein
MKQHTEDYKLSAVQYYLKHNNDMRDTCKIFDCKYQSLARWVKTYKKNKTLQRKTRKNHTRNRKVYQKICKKIPNNYFMGIF